MCYTNFIRDKLPIYYRAVQFTRLGGNCMNVKIHLHNEYVLEGDNMVTLNEELINSISQFVNDLIESFVASEKDFVLDQLKHIYVPNDYVRELYDFQKANGLAEGHTKNDLSEGQAMVINYENDLGQYEAAIFVKAEFMLGLYNYEALKKEFPEESMMVLNTFYHELCHINDDYQTQELFRKDEIFKLSILPRNLFLISIGMWKEYYAYRKAAERFPYGDLMINHFQETYKWAHNAVADLQDKFHNDQDMDDFMYNFTDTMRYFLRVMISVIGNIQGFTSDINIQNELYDRTLDGIPNGGIHKIFHMLVEEMDCLFKEYPSWNSLERFEVINNIIMECFEVFGVYPSEVNNDEMYVGINFISKL